ncbi:glycosyltransferase [Dyella nitratireducens]|uniref:Dolichol monophosphate mannose synthase n=1 Tax=Dyella nitratireducens TaxID=1849580 RepID=A0ABQ1GGK8_9GAMM|nr:glycosyltransferase [Dyella nitratireducens]GGA43051.1 dolichol monophosphate mannose synthase [Dyella nitratireducens]GLQ41923.1 dolichol monophosphate mannose synthase [Dyella nitratireducens]
METLLVQAVTAAPTPETRNYSGEIVPQDVPTLSLVICTLDEHEAIGGVLRELDDHLKGISHEIIVVDDSADNRTADVVDTYAAEHPEVRLVRRYMASGLSSAAIKGWDVAQGRILAIMDGDGQHDPALIRALVEKLANPNVDVAVASRYLDDSRSGLHGLRHRLSRAGTWLTDVTLGVPLADPLSGCFAMSRDWYTQVRRNLSGLGFKILIDVVASGARKPHTAQVPTLLRARAGGESKLDTRVVIDLIALLIEKRTQGRFTASALMGGMAALSALCVQWLTLGVLLKLAMPLWLAVLLSVGLGLAGRFGVNLLMTPRSRRPSHAYELHQRWLMFCLSRWSDIPLNAGFAIALCLAHCPWAIAVLAGLLLAESRYYLGIHAGARA